MDYEFNILYYFDVFKKWRGIIITVVGLSTLLTACISLRMPLTYVSTATILSTGGASSTTSPIGSIGRILGISGISSVGVSSNDVIISILKSKRMAKDIEEQFKLDEKPKFQYKIDINEITGGFAVEVIGSDPELTEKIANFAIENLNKINNELDLTAAKPMAKVLDPATRGERESRQIPRKVLVAGILAFLITSLYAFFSDYIKKIRMASNK